MPTPRFLSDFADKLQDKLKVIDESQEYWGGDGELHCKLCGGLRSKSLEDKTRYFLSYNSDDKGVKQIRIMCPCQADAIEREKEEERKLARIEEINRIVSNSLLGERYVHSNFSDFETEGLDPTISFTKRTVMRYCEKCNDVVMKNNLGLYIYGPTGTGKTEIMACMANELMRKHLKTCLFTSLRELSKQIRATFSSRKKTELDIFRAIDSVDFMFIDDIGYEVLQNNKEDNWLQEKVYDIINTRYNANKPTIFCSNYSLLELCESRGMQRATMERIAEMGSTVLLMKGESYRKRKAQMLFD